jgi:hypothetical protein
MGKFKIMDKVTLNPDSKYNTGEVENPLGVVGTVIGYSEPCKLPITVLWLNGEENMYEEEDLLIGFEVSPTFTQSELDYISELEDEINRLNDLCSDYAKIVAEKDEQISELRSLALTTF